MPWSQKIEARTFPADFCTRNFWGGVCRYAATPLIVALSPGHSDITRFRPWLPIATGNHLDHAEKIRRSSKISSWIWSIISGVVTVLGRPGRGASQVEKSPRLKWATQFLTVAYNGACSPNVSFRMAWISFGALPCRKKTWQLASRYCWNRARRLKCFLSASVTRKDLQFGTWTDPLSNDTIDSVLRHWKVGRAKDLLAPPRKCILHTLSLLQHISVHHILS